jgi:hypothetical protein
MNGRRLEVAVYGLINVGKSSLINALAGRSLQETSPVGGTTRTVTGVPWQTIDTSGTDIDLRLLDTPGLEEIDNEHVAKLSTEAAQKADLVLFVVNEDLTETVLTALLQLHRLGKPIIVALNKVDLLDPGEEEEILKSIRGRLSEIVDPRYVVPIASAPILRERVFEDGRSRISVRQGDPEIGPLHELLLESLSDSALDLKDLNEIRESIESHAIQREETKAERRIRAERVADETGIGLAMALAVNPIPLLDFLTGPSGLVILVMRVASVYGERPTYEAARAMAGQLLHGVRLAFWGSMAAVLGGGAMKLLPGVGHLAGALTQGAAAGYLAHILGRGLVDYFENDHNWGDQGIVDALNKIANRTDRKAITQGIVDQLKARLTAKRDPK